MFNFDFVIQVTKKQKVTVKNGRIYINGRRAYVEKIKVRNNNYKSKANTSMVSVGNEFDTLSTRSINLVADKYASLIKCNNDEVKKRLVPYQFANLETLIFICKYLNRAAKIVKSLKPENHEGMNPYRGITHEYFWNLDARHLGFHSYLHLTDIADNSLGRHLSVSYLYNVRDDDVSPIIKKHNGVISNGHYSQEYKKKCKNVLMNILIFRMIRDEAGDDLINWSSVKLTYWFKKKNIKDKSKWSVERLVNEYKEVLIEKGIEKKIKVVNEDTPAKVSFRKFEANPSAGHSQETLLRGFKNSNKRLQAVPHMEFYTIKHILENEESTEVMKDALWRTRDAVIEEGFKKCEDINDFFWMIYYLRRFTNQKDYYPRQISKYLNMIPFETMLRLQDMLLQEDMDLFFPYNHDDLEIPDDFYNKFLTNLGNKSYHYHKSVTHAHMLRNSDKRNEVILKRITNKKLTPLCYSPEQIMEILEHMPYDKVKKILKGVDDKDLVKHAVPLIKRELDGDLAYKILVEMGEDLSNDQTDTLISLLSKEQNIKLKYHLEAS